MELIRWIHTLQVEIPLLWQCLRDNVYPESFLINVLGLRPESCARLPRMLTIFLGIYLLCGIVTLILRFRRKQRSLNSIANQIGTDFLVCCSSLFVPLLIFLTKTCVYVVQHKVAPFQGEGDFVRFSSDALGSVFYLVLVFAGVLFIVWMPVSSFLWYLAVYRLLGLPHAVFDVGFGLYLMSVILLATYHGKERLYFLLLPVVIALALIQKGGYAPMPRNAPGYIKMAKVADARLEHAREH